jgi:hypothetical protein
MFGATRFERSGLLPWEVLRCQMTRLQLLQISKEQPQIPKEQARQP